MEDRRDESYWKLLDGLSFEYEALNVFCRHGYELESQLSGVNARKMYLLNRESEKFLLLYKTSKSETGFSEYIQSVEQSGHAISEAIIATPDYFTKEFLNGAGTMPVRLVTPKELVELVRTIKD